MLSKPEHVAKASNFRKLLTDIFFPTHITPEGDYLSLGAIRISWETSKNFTSPESFIEFGKRKTKAFFSWQFCTGPEGGMSAIIQKSGQKKIVWYGRQKFYTRSPVKTTGKRKMSTTFLITSQRQVRSRKFGSSSYTKNTLRNVERETSTERIKKHRTNYCQSRPIPAFKGSAVFLTKPGGRNVNSSWGHLWFQEQLYIFMQ